MFSLNKDAEQIKEELNSKYGIPMDDGFGREVEIMCNLGAGLIERGKEEERKKLFVELERERKKHSAELEEERKNYFFKLEKERKKHSAELEEERQNSFIKLRDSIRDGDISKELAIKMSPYPEQFEIWLKINL